MAQKVHWSPYASHVETWGINRVAEFCGAITHHSSDNQNCVVVTFTEEYVTCKNCIRRLRKEENEDNN